MIASFRLFGLVPPATNSIDWRLLTLTSNSHAMSLFTVMVVVVPSVGAFATASGVSALVCVCENKMREKERKHVRG